MKQKREAQATFTPVFEMVLREVGLQAAVVYGRVWRYCQAPGGECYASQRTLAQELGLSDTTVYRALKRLVAGGYIEDRTAGQRYAPHHYRDTGKLSASEGSRALPREAEGPRSASVRGIKIQDPKREEKRQTRGEAVSTRGRLPPRTADFAGSRGLRRPEVHRARNDNDRERAPELRVFREAAGIWPRKQVFDEVISAVRAVGKRLGRETKADDLKPFVKAWVGRGWNPYNLNWLYQWAVEGKLSVTSDQRSASNGKGVGDLRPDGERRTDGENAGGSGAGCAARGGVTAEERERLIRFYNGRGEG